jgi:hypothetical protein
LVVATLEVVDPEVDVAVSPDALCPDAGEPDDETDDAALEAEETLDADDFEEHELKPKDEELLDEPDDCDPL